MMKKDRLVRAPIEFVSWAKTLDEEHSKQTGYPPNLAATLRRLSNWGNGKLVTRGHSFDIIIWRGKRKKNDEKFI